MKTINRIMEALRRSSLAVSAISLIALTCLEIVEIFLRTFFGKSLLIVDEYAGYLLSCMVFMGLCNSFDGGGFVRVEAVYNLFKGGVKKALDIVFTLVLDGLFFVVAYHCVQLNIQNFEMGITSNTVAQTLIWIPQIFMSVGLVMFCIFAALYTVRLIIQLFVKGEEVPVQ